MANKKFNVHILGCGSAKSVNGNHPSCQIVEYGKKMFMLDCGEGAQINIARFGIPTKKIDKIFITHSHGDHCFGTIGIISMMDLESRTEPLDIYVPDQMLYDELTLLSRNHCSNPMKFNLNIHVVDPTKRQIICENEDLIFETIPLNHSVPCCGYRISEKIGQRHILPEVCQSYNIPFSSYHSIKCGNDYILEDGTVIPNCELTTEPSPIFSYAYCSDTRYLEDLSFELKGTTVLYHEATYEADRTENLSKYYHSTTVEAALVASRAYVKQLLIGHFSARYVGLENKLEEEAQSVFWRTTAVHEGDVFDIREASNKDKFKITNNVISDETE